MTDAEINARGQALNNLIKLWTTAVKGDLRGEIGKAGLVHSGDLLKSINSRFRYIDGEISQIRISAARHGFVLATVGKKFTFDNSEARYTTAGVKYVNFSTGNRQSGAVPIVAKVTGRKIPQRSAADDWIFKVISNATEALATQLAEQRANIVVQATGILEQK